MKTLEQVKKQVLFMVEQAKMNDDFYIWFTAKYVIEVMGFSNDYTVVCRGSQYDDAILVQDINNNTVLGLSFNKNEIIEHTYNFLANLKTKTTIMKTLEEVKELMRADLKKFGGFCLPRDYANMTIRFMGFVGQYSAKKVWLNDIVGETNVIVTGETCIYESDESLECLNIASILTWDKWQIVEDTYNFLANIIEEQNQVKEVKKLSEVMPTVMAFHLCKLLQSKANELSFDSFTNYYVENLILAQGNRGVAVDVTNFLGLKSNSQIDVIYKTLRSKVLTK